MPAAILQSPTGDVPLRRKRFTVKEVEQMLEMGLFADERWELIDGDLIDKMGQNPPHAYAITLMMAWLSRIVEIQRIRVQVPSQAGGPDKKWSLPEPDLAVLAQVKDDYRHRHPRGDELLLAVEISDTTLRHDATRKRDLYAQAGVPEYWVLDLNGRQLTVHRELEGEVYGDIQILAEQHAVSPKFAPTSSIEISSLLG